MAGIIVGAYGFQRSGKSLIAHLISEMYYKKGVPVYSNVDVEGYNKLQSLDDLPFNTDPKVLWLDEVQYYLDSRNWKDNTESSIFFNTIGKQNVLLLLTTIHPDMVELRLRRQHNYAILVKSDSKHIYYRIKDNIRDTFNDFTLEKTQNLFNMCRYNSELVPDYIDCDLKKFAEKVHEYNRKFSIDGQKKTNPVNQLNQTKTYKKVGGIYL